MNSLARRLEKIEKNLEPNAGACLRWPKPGGSFIEIPGVSSTVDFIALHQDHIEKATGGKS